MRQTRNVLFLSGVALLGLVLAAPGSAHKPTTTTFTYHEDIYPIVAQKCGSCHRSGGVAPMSLLTYKETYPWAISIKTEVLNLAMPPWFADERYGEFQHAAGLTAREMDTIVEWCLGGSPEGDPPDASDAVSNAEIATPEWSLGAPDLELSMPSPFVLDSDTGEATHEVTLTTALSADRHVRAIDFRPGSANIVRSAMVYLGGAGELLATWIPGQVPVSWSDGRGQNLPAGSHLVLRLHYKKTWLDEGSPVEDQSSLAFYFHEGDAQGLVTTLVISSEGAVAEKDLSFETKAVYVIDKNVELLALLPTLEAQVTSLMAEAVLPDGSRKPLIRLREPNPEWPRKFWLQKPLALPSGSRVVLTVTALEEEPLAAPHRLLLDVIPE